MEEQTQNANLCFTQSFQEQRLLDDFLRSSKLIKIVKSVADEFIKNIQSSKRPENNFSAIAVKLSFIYSDFLNYPLDLLHFVIEEPVQFANAVKYCVFSLLWNFLKDLSDAEGQKINIDIDQVHIQIRFMGLPLQQDLCFQHLNSYRTGLTGVIGILSALSEPEKVVIQSVWYCATGCERNKIKTLSSDVPTCTNCRHPMNEYSKLRYTQNYHLLRILPAESIETPHELNKVFRAVTVRVLDHVYDCKLELGSRYIIIESLREISESQLEALLIYDSPPETPIDVPNPITLSGCSIQNDFNTNDVVGDSYNSSIINNRESLGSELDSEIGLTIFHRKSPNLQWAYSALNLQDNINNDTVIVTTSNIDQMTLHTDEISDISKVDHRNHTAALENNFLELDKIEQNFSVNQRRKSEYFKDQSLHANALTEDFEDDDFEEIDNIFKNIDFENIPIVENSNLNNIYAPIGIQRTCLTQPEFTRDLKDLHENIATCPATIEVINPYLSPENICTENINRIELNNAHLSDISMRDDVQDNNFGLLNFHPCDGNLNDNFCEIDGILETIDLEHITEGASSVQRQSQNELHPTENHLTVAKMSDALSIPFSVRQLHEIVTNKYSDFAFIYALSSQLCQDRVPMECFITLKMGLLLSLVSIRINVDRPPIPIVAITNDTYMTDYLMTNIGQLGSRFLGPVDYVKSFSNNKWIEADSTLLARGGVYYAGDWTRIKLRRADTIFKNIECSSVFVEKSAMNLPLETAIWTHWRSFKHGAKDQQTFNKFLKIFGLPIFVSDDNHESLVDYTLEQASVRIFESTVDHLSINEDDMRHFLVCVSQNDVNLSPEAAHLLKNYFVATRSSREDCLTKQSYVMLKQFAESFAKLSMHKEVLSGDALAAIIMCEHFIENVFPSTPQNSSPHFGNFTFVATVDEYCIRFKEWLNSYIDKYTNE